MEKRYVVETSFTISGTKYIVRDTETGDVESIEPKKSWAQFLANELNEEVEG